MLYFKTTLKLSRHSKYIIYLSLTRQNFLEDPVYFRRLPTEMLALHCILLRFTTKYSSDSSFVPISGTIDFEGTFLYTYAT